MNAGILSAPGFLLLTVLATPLLASAATPSEKCLAAKLKIVAKHDACLLKAHSLFVLKALPAPDIAKCSTKFDEKWSAVEARYGTECPTTGDGGDLAAFAGDHVADVYTLLTGGSLLCGNGVVDAGEDCDGANLGGATCTGEGFGGGGTLACAAECTFDTSACLSCVPGDCVAVDAECGMAGDGCGGSQDCGTCALPQQCGLGGVPSECGGNCLPPTCTELGAACGEHPDQCGGTISCGNCPDGLTCIGTPAMCVAVPGCTPQDPVTACAGRACGKASNGCGGTVDCGTCPDGQGCRHSDGTCQTTGVCIPRTCSGLASGEGTTPCEPTATSGCYCGFVADGCGEVIDCGACLAGEECGGGGPNVCQ